ncbi:MAG: translation initiation factor IF-2 [Candidatus Undinarchaeales archaeon]|nr:translation initiation factor IF-2 [Candidatus Undinarchaeales archaeon]MDP7491594.1 translation initiation factor IF-2 [Candidatus Undinarchaeales archaeon]
MRQPIVSVLGHVDHGKTSILDWIRKTSVAGRESGGITQHIGATCVPLDVVESYCKGLMKGDTCLSIPGLLFIDTPGHHAFTSLRKRGGALSDFALLVVDLNDGFRPQTIESLTILRQSKTPFLVAANKVDMIHGWKKGDTTCITESLKQQSKDVVDKLEERIYTLVGQLSEQGFEGERFDRIADFAKQVSIVPVSAKTGEGIGELLMVLSGLTQQFLKEGLAVDVSAPGKGTILEVKEERGLGTTLDVILYDGTIKEGDTIIVGSLGPPIVARVRALLNPKPLDEIRDPRDKFDSVKEVQAAAGIKIAAPGLENAMAGTTLTVAKNKKEVKRLVQAATQEVSDVLVEQNVNGIVIKADTLGALEALVGMLKALEIPISRADVGRVTKRDVLKAEQVGKTDRYRGIVLGFNTSVLPDAEDLSRNKNVPVFNNTVIYRLLEDYDEWTTTERAKEKEELLSNVVRAGKVHVLRGYVFRQCKPAVVGVEILGGLVKPGYPLMTLKGDCVGRIKGVQDKGENVRKADEGMQVALSIDSAKVGKDFDEDDILLTDIPEPDYRTIKKILEVIRGSEKAALQQIVDIKRTRNPLWALG